MENNKENQGNNYENVERGGWQGYDQAVAAETF